MKFLVDAQLPGESPGVSGELGYDAVHTLDLPSANLTPDAAIIAIADSEPPSLSPKTPISCIPSCCTGVRRKLLLVSTGNISNSQLEALLLPAVPAIINAFASASFVELSRTSLIVHV